VSFQKSARFLEEYDVLAFVELPELLLRLPRLKMYVPDRLTMRILKTQTRLLDLFVISIFTWIGIDIVQAEITDRRFL